MSHITKMQNGGLQTKRHERQIENNNLMNTAAMQYVAPVVKAFMMEQAIDSTSLRSDGRLTLRLDERYRVHLHAAPHQRVALTCQLVSLSSHWDQPAAQDLLQELCTIAAGMLQKHDSSLCLDERQQALCLQQFVAADAPVQVLQDALARFTNALAFWVPICARRTHLLDS